MRKFGWPAICAILGTLGVSVMTGCQSGAGGAAGRDGVRVVRGAGAFAPESLRVHPLTHVEAASGGATGTTSDIVLHVELKDRYNDTVKGLGRLTVLLVRAGAGGVGEGSQDIRWNVPEFEVADSNSGLFDRATRTYRVQLRAPGWVLRAVRDEAPGSLKIRAVLTLEGSEQITLTDEAVLQR